MLAILTVITKVIADVQEFDIFFFNKHAAVIDKQTNWMDMTSENNIGSKMGRGANK